MVRSIRPSQSSQPIQSVQLVVDYILERLKEPSTWRGIVLLLTALGVHLEPQVWEAIVTLGLTLVGGIGAVLPDKLGDN